MVRASSKYSEIIKLFYQGYGRFKFQLILLAALGFFSGVLEGIGINALVPLLSLVTEGTSQTQDRISSLIEKFYNFFGLNYSIPYLILFIVFLFIAKAIVLLVFQYISIHITAEYERRTRSDIFNNTIQARWPYLMKEKIGHLEKVIMTDAENSTHLLRSLNDTILTVTTLAMYIIIALNVSIFITLIALLSGIAIFFLFKPLLSKTARISRQYADNSKTSAHHINESMLGIKTIKALGVESGVLKKAQDIFNNLKNARIKLYLYAKVRYIFLQPISIVFLLAVFALSYRTDEFSLASFAVTIYLIQKIFAYFENMQGGIHSISENISYLQSTVNYRLNTKKHKEQAIDGKPFALRRSLEFKNVGFYYQNNDKPILDNLSFTIERGQMVGLIGPSGAGKTTIVDLLLRFFQPHSGTITIDGTSISEVGIAQWRKNIGYVSQDIFLLNDTIKNNIQCYDNTVTDDAIQSAAHMANCYDFIMQQRNQFETVVGERGVLLSAGQRQRIILARILARKPELLILDEATSALDNESESLIHEALNKIKGTITVIVIAHRLSTVMNSDKLLTLDNGRITEQGTPQELIKSKDSYFYKVNSITASNAYV